MSVLATCQFSQASITAVRLRSHDLRSPSPPSNSFLPKPTRGSLRRNRCSPLQCTGVVGHDDDDHHHHAMAEVSPALKLPEGAFELRDESDFDLLSSDGLISICGFGSLLSERSARSTFPDLRGFRIARLRGFRRVFQHAAPVFFERGIAREETGEISSLSVEPCAGEELITTVFEIRASKVPSFIEREHEFRFLAVKPEDMSGKLYDNPAVLCARYSDAEYLQVRCKGWCCNFHSHWLSWNPEIFFQRYGRFNIHKIWRNDILPCRVYLRHCVLAARNLGEVAHENFLDHTFIGDLKTTIRQYLSSTGSGIMEEEPPEALRNRYGG